MADRSTDDAGGSRVRPFLLRKLLALVLCGLSIAAYFAVVRQLEAHHAGFWTMMGATVVYGVVIIAIAVVMTRSMVRATGLLCSPAGVRYRRRFLGVMTAYVAALIAAIGIRIRLHPTGVLAYLTAIAPAVPIVAAIVVMGLYLREETDEVERAIKSESALWATGGLLSIASVWGFLEMFGLAPHVEVWAAFPVWALFLGPAEIFTRRRYR